MASYNTPFEIHVHGEVPLRADVSFEQIQDALKPLWKYAGSKSLAAGAASVYEEEPGIKFDAPKHLLQMCWTVPGDEDFRQALDEMCMGLNDLAEAGAPIEVTFYDSDFDDEEDGDEEDIAVYALDAAGVALLGCLQLAGLLQSAASGREMPARDVAPASALAGKGCDQIRPHLPAPPPRTDRGAPLAAAGAPQQAARPRHRGAGEAIRRVMCGG